jgi:hypothetical protein
MNILLTVGGISLIAACCEVSSTGNPVPVRLADANDLCEVTDGRASVVPWIVDGPNWNV